MTHIGKKIEEIVRVKRIPIVEFAKQINTTRNNLYNIFNRESIDTELLRKIGVILDYDFFLFLSKIEKGYEQCYANKSGKQSSLHSPRIAELRKLEDKIHHLEKEIEQYKERLVDKEEIIKLLKKEGATNTY
jgi:hypothetical protein